MQNNNHIYTIQDIYTTAPIEQSTDRLTNQTSFLVNFYHAHQRADTCEVDSITDVKCKYCKGYYFPDGKQASQLDSYSGTSDKKRLGNRGLSESKHQNKFICGLCSAVNDIKEQALSDKLPQFQHIHPRHKQLSSQNHNPHKFNSSFQSLIIHRKQKDPEIPDRQDNNKYNPSYDHKQNTISFMFFLDLSTLHKPILQQLLSYLKTVIREYFSRNNYQLQTNPQIDDIAQTSTKSSALIPQQYRVILALNLNDQLHLCDLNTLSTISIQSLAKQKILSAIPTQNTPDMYQKQTQRKQSLVKLIHQCSVNLAQFQSWDNIDEYFEFLLQDMNQDQESVRTGHGVNGILHYNMLMALLAVNQDVTMSYIMSYIGGSPLLNYQPHRVSKSTIYSLCYIFHRPHQQTHTHHNEQLQTKSVTNFTPIASTKPHLSNLKNQLLLIRDNHEVHFVAGHEQGLQQFYYLLYELFGIVEMPKMFKPKWSMKTDNKYPPILSNDFPVFFIKPSSILMFVVSCLINTTANHNKFQISVAYQDSQRRQKVWIINFTKDTVNQSHQLNQIYRMNNLQLNPSNQTQPYALLQKLPTIYNYLYLLSKFAIGFCMRGIKDVTISKHTQPQRSIFTSNTITTHQICVLFESFINKGVFKMGNIEIGCEYVESIYEYCSGVKNIPYEMLKFMSNCEINPRKAAQMIYPLLVRNYSQETSSCIVYWGDGYYCLNDHSQDQNSQDQDWYAQFIDAHHQSESKYYTKRSFYQSNNNSDQNELIKFYLKKLNLKQNRLSYLPIYFINQNE